MKKLIGILVLGFFWCNISFAESTLPPCQGEDERQWTNCQGTHTLPNVEKYVGEWKDGKFHDQGTFTFADGRKYVGGFKDGSFHGLGKYKCSSIKKYLGILDCKPGRIIKGIWEDSELVGVLKLNF